MVQEYNYTTQREGKGHALHEYTHKQTLDRQAVMSRSICTDRETTHRVSITGVIRGKQRAGEATEVERDAVRII